MKKWKKYTPCKCKPKKNKKSWGSNTYIRQNRLQNKALTKSNEGHYIIILKRLIQKKNITHNEILVDIKRDINRDTLIVGDFNMALTPMD